MFGQRLDVLRGNVRTRKIRNDSAVTILLWGAAMRKQVVRDKDRQLDIQTIQLIEN